MGMVHVRRMRMRMRQRRVFVSVGMWFAWWIIGPMGVAMMLVVTVRMGMRHRLMCVWMFMMLGQMQPDACGHQQSRDCELCRQRFAERNHRAGSAKERCCREVRACARSTEAAQREHE